MITVATTPNTPRAAHSSPGCGPAPAESTPASAGVIVFTDGRDPNDFVRQRAPFLSMAQHAASYADYDHLPGDYCAGFDVFRPDPPHHREPGWLKRLVLHERSPVFVIRQLWRWHTLPWRVST